MTTALTRAVDCAPIHMVNMTVFMGIDIAEAQYTWVIGALRHDGSILILDAGFTAHPRRNWTPKDVVLQLRKPK